ncbi:AMP-binding protein [Gordonia rubripertincta]|uniref:AMP-binding protein n=1 Tax=Gordonia rubripertincta TaxID=36822 RepID=A0ABT4MQM0_GORRU|nr:AMP-binding protein [Gordonia rubripertincta]MCZ4549299.1 AMP-binding protein [Gordonia rubripertincta]
MRGLPNIKESLDRVVATAQNGLEVIRYGSLETGTKPAPFRVEETVPMYRLRRYFPDDAADGPPVVLVPPMMVSANVYDVTADNGAVTILHDAGLDPWVVDFGSPDKVDGGMDRTLADHIVSISEVIDSVREVTGRDVHLAGYSQGGMFCYQTAAFRRSKGIASVITYGSPVDVLGALPLGLPAALVSPGAQFLADNVFNRLAIPGWLARTGFQLVDPVKAARSRIDFLRQLHDREALLPREDSRRFIEVDGWVAWSGPAVAELLRQFVVHNRMVGGGFVIGDQVVTLAEVTSPVLAFLGEADDIGQPVAVRGILRAAPLSQVYESSLPVGHFGLVVGSTAGTRTWPTTAEWIRWQDGTGPQPEAIEKMHDDSDRTGQTGVSLSSRVAHGLGSAAGVGAEAGRDIVGAARSVTRTTDAVFRESARVLPRLVRLGQLQSRTTISLGKLMNENARKHGQRELFLFEDRVLSHRQVNDRIDNVVRGLISCGVRPGQHVGVLMATRPSALVAIAALSRLGAVAVMLSPGNDLKQSLRLGDCSLVLADPANLDDSAAIADRVLVLGGGAGDSRTLAQADGERIIDMEQIDPDAVEVPSWYRPDPGRAGDLAFVLFSKNGGTLEKWPVTNHRWALSAFGAASAAALSGSDTVYCLTPLHHASGLLTALGGTVAGGARIALSGEIDPERFATEVYRYGITVVSYTWSMLQDVIQSDELAIGVHNPIRLFMGSGMPTGLWDDIVERFPRARVLEFFATGDGSAILANVTGTKVGSAGRPVPGVNDVAIAAYDLSEGRLITDSNGFVREARVDEVGVMMSKAGQQYEVGATVLRDVFNVGDRWQLSEHMFKRDADGDFWFMGHTSGVVISSDGYVYPQPIIDGLSRLIQVKHAVVYKVGEPGRQLAIAAVSKQEDTGSPTGSSLRLALAGLTPAQRPHIIRVLDTIEVTNSYRPRAEPMREAGIPAAGAGVWFRDEDGRYRRLTKAIATERGWQPGAQVVGAVAELH